MTMLRILLGTCSLFTLYHLRNILSDYVHRKVNVFIDGERFLLATISAFLWIFSELSYLVVVPTVLLVVARLAPEVVSLPQHIVEGVLMFSLAYIFVSYDPARDGQDDIDPFGFEKGTPHARATMGPEQESPTGDRGARAADLDARGQDPQA